jgi:hypothetical protein
MMKHVLAPKPTKGIEAPQIARWKIEPKIPPKITKMKSSVA